MTPVCLLGARLAYIVLCVENNFARCGRHLRRQPSITTPRRRNTGGKCTCHFVGTERAGSMRRMRTVAWITKEMCQAVRNRTRPSVGCRDAVSPLSRLCNIVTVLHRCVWTDRWCMGMPSQHVRAAEYRTPTSPMPS